MDRQEFETLWADLAAEDATKAHRDRFN